MCRHGPADHTGGRYGIPDPGPREPTRAVHTFGPLHGPGSLGVLWYGGFPGVLGQQQRRVEREEQIDIQSDRLDPWATFR